MVNDRRAEPRIPVELTITQFIDDRPFESLASDLSASGLGAARLLAPMNRSSRVIQLEIPLPGLPDPLWTSAEVVYDSLDPFYHISGIRFRSMASHHRRLLADWLRATPRLSAGTLPG